VTDAVTSSVEGAYVVCRCTRMPLSTLTSTRSRKLWLLRNLLLLAHMLLAHLLLRHARMASTWMRTLARCAIRVLRLLLMLLLWLRSMLLGSRLVLYRCATWGREVLLLLLLLRVIYWRRVLRLTAWRRRIMRLLVCRRRRRRWRVGLAC
jgi:hypothetical protein